VEQTGLVILTPE